MQNILTSPDDSNAVLDSGAMMTTALRRLLMTSPEWESNIRPAAPGTAIRYGNMETEPVKEVSHIGSLYLLFYICCIYLIVYLPPPSLYLTISLSIN